MDYSTNHEEQVKHGLYTLSQIPRTSFVRCGEARWSTEASARESYKELTFAPLGWDEAQEGNQYEEPIPEVRT